MNKLSTIVQLPISDGQAISYAGINFGKVMKRVDLKTHFLYYGDQYDTVILTDLDACLGIGDNEKLIKSLLRSYPSLKIYIRTDTPSFSSVSKWYDFGAYGVIVDTILGNSEYLVNSLVHQFPDTVIALNFMPSEGVEKWCYFNKGLRTSTMTIQGAYDLIPSGNIMITNMAKVGSRKGFWSPERFWGNNDCAWYCGGIHNVNESREALIKAGFSGAVVTTAQLDVSIDAYFSEE